LYELLGIAAFKYSSEEMLSRQSSFSERKNHAWCRM